MFANFRRASARSSVGALMLFAVGSLAPSAAQAYSWSTCWDRTVKWNRGWNTMALTAITIPPGSDWDVRYQNAMWHWNNVKGSSFTYYYSRAGNTVSLGNGVSEVYGTDLGTGGTLGVTRTRYHCNRTWFFDWSYSIGIDETDMAFNTRVLWSLGPLNYGNLGSPISFESVALHELGHALGLGHEDRRLATMNSYYPNSGPLGHYKEWDPLGDDRLGARYLYPDGTTETDVAGSVFRWVGSGSSGLVYAPQTARRGDTVTLQYTVQNLSTSARNFDAGFYLSTNDYISTSDTLLGTSGFSAPAGSYGTFYRTLTIPTNIAPGAYWLGFLVDRNNAISESNEYNNNMEMPFSIRIY